MVTELLSRETIFKLKWANLSSKWANLLSICMQHNDNGKFPLVSKHVSIL